MIVTAATNKLEVLEDDRQTIALLTGGFVFPGVKPEAAFNEERTTFGAILGNDFALAAPCFHVDKRGLFALLTGAVFKRAVNRQTELADRRTLRRDPEFRVASEVSDEEDAI